MNRFRNAFHAQYPYASRRPGVFVRVLCGVQGPLLSVHQMCLDLEQLADALAKRLCSEQRYVYFAFEDYDAHVVEVSAAQHSTTEVVRRRRITCGGCPCVVIVIIIIIIISYLLHHAVAVFQNLLDLTLKVKILYLGVRKPTRLQNCSACVVRWHDPAE